MNVDVNPKKYEANPEIREPIVAPTPTSAL
jgi:hypothetical protein